MTTHIIPQLVNDRLDYNCSTGVFTWKYKNKSHPRLYGQKAGFLNYGYLIIKINSIPFRAHRIAWFIMTGNQPQTIDHINGNKSDNRFVNLRNVTPSENAKNHGKKFNKSNLPCGVRLLPSGKYQARIACNKIVYHLGSFYDSESAEQVYLLKRKDLFKEYARR